MRDSRFEEQCTKYGVTPTPQLRSFAEAIYEDGWVAGKQITEKLLRIRLGLAVPGDDA